MRSLPDGAVDAGRNDSGNGTKLHMSHIVIIGGGCTGALTALNLLRCLPHTGFRITIIEPRPTLGAGLAYSSVDTSHRVNIPAEGMTVFDDEPGAFLNWLHAAGEVSRDPQMVGEDGHHYPRRILFGAYLNQLLRGMAAKDRGFRFRHVQAIAENIERHGDGYLISGNGFSQIHGDIVILAVSHPAPAIPAAFRHLAKADGFIADPWDGVIGAKVARGARVLLIGTALTAMDVVASLSENGHQGDIVAVSRRGLLSRGPRARAKEPLGDFTTSPHKSALTLLRHVRAEFQNAERTGLGPEAVLESLRNQLEKIWDALEFDEKSRFLRHLRAFWDAHRYRMAPQIRDVILTRQAGGQFTPLAARIISADRDGQRFKVALKRRGQEAITTEHFDVIINCTGPDHRNVISTNPVLAALASQGLILPDRLGLGIETGETANAIDRTGEAVRTLFVAGPLARARFGEITGLSQIKRHVAFVVGKVAETANRPAAHGLGAGARAARGRV